MTDSDKRHNKKKIEIVVQINECGVGPSVTFCDMGKIVSLNYVSNCCRTTSVLRTNQSDVS